MNENLKSKITDRLDDLSDELGRQLLDYMDFLRSKYNANRRAPSTFQRLAEGIEDRLQPGQLSDAAVKGAAQVVDAAGKVMSGLAAATKAVADELQGDQRGSPSRTANSQGGTPEPATDEADRKEDGDERSGA